MHVLQRTRRWDAVRPICCVRVMRDTGPKTLAGLTIASVCCSRQHPVLVESLREGPLVKPTVILVHGAFAESSTWNDVIDFLTAEGLSTIAMANPLRGIAAD